MAGYGPIWDKCRKHPKFDVFGVFLPVLAAEAAELPPDYSLNHHQGTCNDLISIDQLLFRRKRGPGGPSGAEI